MTERVISASAAVKRRQEDNLPVGLPGQDLVMAGYMALSGTAAMIRWDRERLKKRLPEELLTETTDLEAAQKEKRSQMTEGFFSRCGATAVYPVGVGGVFNALWHLADQWNTGFTVQLKKLPVRQETIEICEVEEKNPYYLWSTDCFLLAADHGYRLCEALGTQGIPATVIGVLTDKKDKTLVHDSTISCLNRPREDELDQFMIERGVPLV